MNAPPRAELPDHPFYLSAELRRRDSGAYVGDTHIELALYTLDEHYFDGGDGDGVDKSRPPVAQTAGWSAARGGRSPSIGRPRVTPPHGGYVSSHGRTWCEDAPPSELPQTPRLQRCTLKSSSTGPRSARGGVGKCAFTLPSTGRYVAAACEVNESGERVTCTGLVLGKTAAEWAAAPLGSYANTAFGAEMGAEDRRYARSGRRALP